MTFMPMPLFCALFRQARFPGEDPVVQQLNAAILLPSALSCRPIGGWLFGHLADHYGRRSTLMLSVLLMCFGSLMIAVTPTYASIGVRSACAAGARARVVQGLSLGGEYGTSATYLTEVAAREASRLLLDVWYVTLIGGQLVAIVVLLLLQQVFLSADQLRAWGWRIPFVIGALLAVIALVMRRNLHETEDFIAAKKGGATRDSPEGSPQLSARSDAGHRPDHGRHDRLLYLHHLYAEVLKLSVGLSDGQTTLVTGASLVFALFAADLWRAIGQDRPQTLLIWFGVTGTLFTVPLLYALQGTKSALVAFLLIAAAWLIVAGYTSINAVVKAELFPTRCGQRGGRCHTRSPFRSSAAPPSPLRSGSNQLVMKPGFITT